MAPDPRRRIFLFSILLIGVFVAPGFAAPRLKIVEPPAKQIATGENVVLRVQLDWPSTEGPYEVSSLEPKLENLALVDQNQSQETGATISQTLLYEFRPLRIGPAVIYPFEVRYRRNEYVPWTPLLVPEYKIHVISNLPVTVALIGALIVAGLLLTVFLGLKLWGGWKVRAAAQRVLPNDPRQRIYQQAEEAIMNFNSKDPKEKLTLWANQFRIVVETYYAVSSIATAADILAFLKVKGIPAGEWNEVSRIFGELTEMQFSRNNISEYDLAKMQRTLLQYVAGKIIIGASNP